MKRAMGMTVIAALVAACATAPRTVARPRPAIAAQGAANVPERPRDMSGVIAFVRAIGTSDPQRAAHLRRAMAWSFAFADEARARMAPFEPNMIMWVENNGALVREPDAIAQRDAERRASLERMDHAMEFAVSCAQRALRLEPNAPEAPAVLLELGGRLAQWARDADGPYAEFVRRFHGHSQVGEAHLGLGVAFAFRRRFEEAKASLEQAARLGTPAVRAVAQLNLSQIAYIERRYDESVELARLVLREPSARELERDAVFQIGSAMAEGGASEAALIAAFRADIAPRAEGLVREFLRAVLLSGASDEATLRAAMALFVEAASGQRAAFCALERPRESVASSELLVDEVGALRRRTGCPW
ncbi:MAG: hypothetical protein JNK05_02325 [Myxococcales bacterium]|nr:hypothetical protein [Myxococcales bacterium]